MNNIDKHKPGAFCWVELATTDHSAAKNFYSSLFAWSANDIPMGPGGVYTIFELQGRAAAAGYELNPQQRAQGVPPHWIVYIAVENADAAASRATHLGGSVVIQPFDITDVGRMAVLTDPTGAYFCIWQPKRNQGIGIAGVNGTLCWADLNTPDPDRAKKFYSELFGWKITEDTDDDPPSGYLHIQNGGDFIGGIPPVRPNNPRQPAHWLAYFEATNCDSTAAQAKKLGAKFYLEPMTMENVGRFAILADPQGAVFAIFQSARK
jgi:uncharacterized protein